MKAKEFMTRIDEGVKRNALYQKVGRMLGKGHDINAIKKRYKDIDDAHPGHIEKIVQALKDRNEIPGHLKRIKGSDVEEDIKETTSAGSVAAVAMPIGAVQSRTGSKKKKKDTKTKESGLQRYTGIKKYGKKGFEALQKAGREGASEEEKGAIKDKYLKKKK